MRDDPAILVVNPGSSTTRVALFDGSTKIWSKVIEHRQADPGGNKLVAGQVDRRKDIVDELLAEKFGQNTRIDAVAARGGLLRPVQGGTYIVSDQMCADLEAARYGEHASNLGALLARRFGERFDVPAFVVDPVTIDEFEPVSRISGVPGIERKCRNHALNIKAVARCSADEMDVSFDKSRFVVAHLGGGISVCALRDGRIIDSTDALLGEGPFSAERAGTLPLAAVIDMCFEGGRSRDEVVKLLSCESGLRGYLGETRIPEICGLIDEGDEQARLVLEALMLQTAKWIGAMFVVLEGSVNAILLTGGMAKSQKLVDDIIRRVGALADVRIYPGELEMEALAAGALRVLRGEERAKQY